MVAIDELRTDRLLLRRIQAEHRDDLVRMHADERVMATLGGVRSAALTAGFLEGALAHWQHYGFGLWMVYDPPSGRFAGRGGLHHVMVEGQDEVEVAYAFMSDFWGQGLATELATESVRVAFEIVGLRNIVCFTLTTNRASQRVMEKVGFVYERPITHANLPHVLYRLDPGQRRAVGAGAGAGVGSVNSS
jgi:RimJ/RimL family protein N-acetyltransferase